jgi:hypothetical protein
MASFKSAKRIDVDLDTQTMKALLGGKEMFAFNCVTGDKLHQTEPGTFRIIRKSPKHVSHKYKVPMHWALFFTQDGKALHQYHGIMPLAMVRMLKESVSDYLGSHGCVRLVEADAQALYEWAPLGTLVHVKGRLT